MLRRLRSVGRVALMLRGSLLLLMWQRLVMVMLLRRLLLRLMLRLLLLLLWRRRVQPVRLLSLFRLRGLRLLGLVLRGPGLHRVRGGAGLRSLLRLALLWPLPAQGEVSPAPRPAALRATPGLRAGDVPGRGASDVPSCWAGDVPGAGHVRGAGADGDGPPWLLLRPAH